MPVRFPVKAAAHSRADVQTICIFDDFGYWASLDSICFEVLATSDTDNAALATTVARMLNAAYEQGKDDARAEVRDALGIRQED